MGIINFSFNAPKPKVEKKLKTTRKAKTKTKKQEHFHIIQKDIETEIVEINDTLGCNVEIEGVETFVPLHKESLDCHNISRVYRKINGMYITHLRCKEDFLGAMPDYYYPVKPSVKVMIFLVKDYEKFYAYIKKIMK